jgi:hypothetical protein
MGTLEGEESIEQKKMCRLRFNATLDQLGGVADPDFASSRCVTEGDEMKDSARNLPLKPT